MKKGDGIKYYNDPIFKCVLCKRFYPVDYENLRIIDGKRVNICDFCNEIVSLDVMRFEGWKTLEEKAKK